MNKKAKSIFDSTHAWRMAACCLSAACAAFSPRAAFAVPFDEALFTHKSTIVISGYAGESTLNDFPVLVTLAANSPAGFDYADCAADGSDIRFVDMNGDLAPHEIEKWNAEGTSYIWVKVPRLSGTATQLTLFYGSDSPALPAVSASDVWSQYAVVIHGGSSLTNAVGNGLAVAAGSASVIGSTTNGVSAGGISKTTYSGIGLNVSNPSPKLSNVGQFSVSAWFNRDGEGGRTDTKSHYLAASRTGWANMDGFALIFEHSEYISVSYKNGHNWSSGNYLLDEHAWRHIAFSYAAGEMVTSYFDGNKDQSKRSPATLVNTNVTYWTFGSYANTSETEGFRGEMDEIRVFNGFASGDWIKAEHDTAANPASFAVLGAVEAVDVAAPQFGLATASDKNGTVSFNIDILRPGLGGGVPTSVSVFYGTDGEHWTEKSLGSRNTAGRLAGSVSGFAADTKVYWFARATATSSGDTKIAETSRRSLVTKACDPAMRYKSFTATVNWDGIPVENIPVLVRLSDGNPVGFIHREVKACGFEVLDEDGYMLPYEIDTWDPSGESLIWVLVRDYRDGATFTVRYGSSFANAPLPSTDVWAGYAGVWHLNDTNSASAYGTYPNSTAAAGIDGEKAQASIADEDGKIGKSVKICNATAKGTGFQYGGVFMPDSGADSPLDLGDTFMISGWFKHKNQNYYFDQVFSKRQNSANTTAPTGAFMTQMYVNGAATTFGVFGNSGQNTQKTTTLATLNNVWSRLSVAFDGTSCHVYQDGVLKTTMTGIAPVTTNDSPLCIGNVQSARGNGLGDAAWCGWVDEVRLLGGYPGPTWLNAEHHAMADDSALDLSEVSEHGSTGFIFVVH